MSKNCWTIRGLLLVILVDYLGVGVVFVIAPAIFLSPKSLLFTTHTNFAELKLFFCLFLTMYPLGQFFGANKLGQLSDKYGRRTILLITIIGTFLGYLILMAGLLLHSVLLLIGGRLLSGLFAGNVAVAQASIIDLSDHQSKAKNISLIQSIIGLAWIIGTPLGGLLYGRMTQPLFKYTAPILLVLFLILIMFGVIYFFYTETRVTLDDRKNDPPKTITQTNWSSSVNMLLVVWFLFILAQWVFEALMPAYFVEKYAYSDLHIGVILGSMGLIYSLIQILVVRKLANRVNHNHFIMVSFLVAAGTLLGFATSHGHIQMYISLLLYVISMAFILSYYTTLISNQVDESRQGAIMGKLSSLQAIAAIVAMLMGGSINIFNTTAPMYFGFIILLLSAVLFIAYQFLTTGKTYTNET